MDRIVGFVPGFFLEFHRSQINQWAPLRSTVGRSLAIRGLHQWKRHDVRRAPRVWTMSDMRPTRPTLQILQGRREFYGQREREKTQARSNDSVTCHYALPARRHGHMKFVCDVNASSTPRYAVIFILYSDGARPPTENEPIWALRVFPFEAVF